MVKRERDEKWRWEEAVGREMLKWRHGRVGEQYGLLPYYAPAS